MKSYQSITIDLIEENHEELEELIETDIYRFIKEDLWTLYWSFQHHKGNFDQLKQELRQLIRAQQLPSKNCWAYVDEWSIHLFGKEDICTSNRCRYLLLYLYTEFKESEVFQWIQERFAMNEKTLLASSEVAQVLDWLILWMTQTYPTLALFLIGSKALKPYLALKCIPLRQVILYLPQFMVWKIRKALDTKQKRFLAEQLASGKNIRRIKACPAPFTKKMAHWFTNAPRESSFESAVWYGIVLGMGGNQFLAQAFETFLRRWDGNFAFLKIVVPFSVNQSIKQIIIAYENS